ncbi:MAG: hypothetical protein ACI8Y3_001696, partial [Paraglaciecola sp.]
MIIKIMPTVDSSIACANVLIETQPFLDIHSSAEYVINRDSQEEADLHVLESCKKYNVRFNDTYPCSLINVSDKWLDSPNRAKEILGSLPKFTPETP